MTQDNISPVLDLIERSDKKEIDGNSILFWYNGAVFTVHPDAILTVEIHDSLYTVFDTESFNKAKIDKGTVTMPDINGVEHTMKFYREMNENPIIVYVRGGLVNWAAGDRDDVKVIVVDGDCPDEPGTYNIWDEPLIPMENICEEIREALGKELK